MRRAKNHRNFLHHGCIHPCVRNSTLVFTLTLYLSERVVQAVSCPWGRILVWEVILEAKKGLWVEQKRDDVT